MSFDRMIPAVGVFEKETLMGMQDTINDLERQVKKLEKTNVSLQTDNDVLTKENENLSEQVTALKQSTADLLTKNDELQKQLDETPPAEMIGAGDRLVAQAAITTKKFFKGKLQGEKYIKTDAETGKFEEITKAEFDSLPSK